MQGLWERVYTSQDIEAHPADGLNVQAGPSLIVDTPDRKIPYQPWAMELRKEMATRFISPLAACLVPGVPRYVIAPAPTRFFSVQVRSCTSLNIPTRTASFRPPRGPICPTTFGCTWATRAAAGRETRSWSTSRT